MAKHVFIDTNIFLSFYHYTSDDLEELQKFAHLLNQGELKLYLPEQIEREFKRNRENKISDSLGKLREQSLNLQFPQICKQYTEYETLRDLQKEYGKAHSNLIEKVNSDVQERTLKADEIIDELFEQGIKIETSNEILETAQKRIVIGDPPGKNDSHGDAINWEALKSGVPSKRNIQFVTDDRDYASKLDNKKFSEYLSDEWANTNGGKVVFFRSMNAFFKRHYPSINIADEISKDKLISDLASSGSFTNTHNVIAQLSQFSEFTESQVNAIASAAINNNQVSWISLDHDVFNFLKRILDEEAEKLDLQMFIYLSDLLEPKKEPKESNSDSIWDDFPF